MPSLLAVNLTIFTIRLLLLVFCLGDCSAGKLDIWIDRRSRYCCQIVGRKICRAKLFMADFTFRGNISVQFQWCIFCRLWCYYTGIIVTFRYYTVSTVCSGGNCNMGMGKSAAKSAGKVRKLPSAWRVVTAWNQCICKQLEYLMYVCVSLFCDFMSWCFVRNVELFLLYFSCLWVVPCPVLLLGAKLSEVLSAFVLSTRDISSCCRWI